VTSAIVLAMKNHEIDVGWILTMAVALPAHQQKDTRNARCSMGSSHAD